MEGGKEGVEEDAGRSYCKVLGKESKVVGTDCKCIEYCEMSSAGVGVGDGNDDMSLFALSTWRSNLISPRL